MSMQAQINKFIKDFKAQHEIDYRRDVFLNNQYGNSPCFNYDFAKKIVISLNNDLIDLFDGEQWVIYNLDMDIESLRITKLSIYIESRVTDYFRYKNESIYNYVTQGS